MSGGERLTSSASIQEEEATTYARSGGHPNGGHLEHSSPAWVTKRRFSQSNGPSFGSNSAGYDVMRGKRVFLTAALVFGLAAAGVAAESALHFALRQSAPAADATVAPPEEVRLWFTEAPEANSVSIRLVNAAGAQVPTSDAATDPESAAVYFVKPTARLAEGRYTVAWRGIGDDGHPATGNFGFTVAAQ